MTMAEKIQTLRQAQNLSQEQLAERLEVSRQSVSKWESGQSRPDMDKLVILAELFAVPTDYLLKEGETIQPPPRRMQGTLLLLMLTAALALTASVWLGVKSSRIENTGKELQAENLLLRQTGEQLKADLQTAENALADERSGSPRSFEALEAYYYQFAQTYRFDYVPEFAEGNTPTESPDYLMYAFAINLDNWGEQKGRMSKAYVDEVALSYFNQPSISHMPMRKCWDFDGATYSALPQGVNPKPVYLLRSCQTYLKENNTYYEVVLDNCVRDDGVLDPAALNLDSLQKLLSAYGRDSFHPIQREKFVYYLSGHMAGEKPVFVSHELLPLDSAGQ